MTYLTRHDITRIFQRNGGIHAVSPIFGAGIAVPVTGQQRDLETRGTCLQLAPPYPENAYVMKGDLVSTSAPPPGPIPTSLWRVRGDEELSRFDYHSRTLMQDWAYLEQTPSVFRFDRYAADPTLWKVDITPLLADIDRINNFAAKDNRRNYLFSGGTALFNGNSFPRQTYLTMSGNMLAGVGIEGRFLKFATIKPTDDVSSYTRETHPQFVHRWDIVTADKQPDGSWITNHVNTPHGDLFWFLCSRDGHGYIPLELVAPVQ